MTDWTRFSNPLCPNPGPRSRSKVRLNVRVERLDDTPGGVPNGRIIFHTDLAHPHHQAVGTPWIGAVLGRGYSEDESIADFVRRANMEAKGGPWWSTSELAVVERSDNTLTAIRERERARA